MKRTRQRCKVAFSTLATAALMPSWASEITSLTLRKQRRASLRRNAVQKASASGGLRACIETPSIAPYVLHGPQPNPCPQQIMNSLPLLPFPYFLSTLLSLLRRPDVVRMVDSRPSREPMQSHLHGPSVPGLLNERSGFLQLG